jgi:ABC-type nitrate/sulfonate/bicarbonate transport system permease component
MTLTSTMPAQTAGTRMARRLSGGLVEGFKQVWLLILIVVCAEIWLRTHPSFFMPSLSAIAQAFQELWLSGPADRLFLSDTFMNDVGVSFFRILSGFAAAAVVGIVLGMLAGRIKRVRWALSPLVRLGTATPAVVMVPLALVVFGLSNATPIFAIAFGSVWPVLINTMDGVRAIDPMTLRSARVIGVRGPKLYRVVVLPAAAPSIMSGLRVSIGIAVVVAVSAELYASTAGVGFEIVAQQRMIAYPEMFAAVWLAALIGIVLNKSFSVVERLVLKNRPPSGLT